MPVTITVSQVRQELLRAAGAGEVRGEGEPATAALGRRFHEVLSQLVGDPSGPLRRLSEVDPELELWKKVLVGEVYSKFIGPLLTSEQAALHDSAPQVLVFWKAVQAACHWL